MALKSLNILLLRNMDRNDDLVTGTAVVLGLKGIKLQDAGDTAEAVCKTLVDTHHNELTFAAHETLHAIFSMARAQNPQPSSITITVSPENDLVGQGIRIAKVLERLARKDFSHVVPLNGSMACVAHFKTDRGLRCYGQSSLVAGQKGTYGIVITEDGRVATDAEAQNLLNIHNQIRHPV